MRKVVLALSIIVGCTPFVAAQVQTAASSRAESATRVTQQADAINIRSGTRLAAQLQSALDVKKANVGDEVVLKTTESIKQDGQVVVKKGARLIGRVTEVQQRSRGESESRIGLMFDRLESGKLAVPITATITSITRTRAQSSLDSEGAGTRAETRSSTATQTQTQSRAGEGGLLGGVTNTVGSVTNTVGGVVNTTTQTTGSVVGATGETVGSTSGAVTGTLSGITISQSTSASSEGGSTLSLSGDNLKLQKGTTFHLTISQSSSVSRN